MNLHVIERHRKVESFNNEAAAGLVEKQTTKNKTKPSGSLFQFVPCSVLLMILQD